MEACLRSRLSIYKEQVKLHRCFSSRQTWNFCVLFESYAVFRTHKKACYPTPFQTTKTRKIQQKIISVLAQGSWRDLRYECRIIGSEENGSITTEFTRINETSLEVPISPGLQYHVSVRACISTVCSSFANTTNTAFGPYTGTRFASLQQLSDICALLSNFLDQ